MLARNGNSHHTCYRRASLVAQIVESACNAEDPGSITGSERSPGEWNGYPLQCSCLGNLMNRGPWWAIVHGVAKRHDRETNTSTSHMLQKCSLRNWVSHLPFVLFFFLSFFAAENGLFLLRKLRFFSSCSFGSTTHKIKHEF